MSFNNGPTVVTNGLVLALDAGDRNSYVSGSTTWFDLTGVNNGTLVNGPTFNTGSGGSIVFDGVDDSCYVGAYPNLALSQFTLSVWCYPTNAQNSSGAGRFIAGYGDVNNWTFGYGIFTYPYQNSGAQVNFNISGNTPSQYTQLLINNNQWYNFVLTYDGTLMRSYSNNIFIESKARTLVYNATNRFTLADGYLYNAPFKGNISSTQVYNRALSAQEVLQNYNATKGRFGL